jgi:hypothetical protein
MVTFSRSQATNLWIAGVAINSIFGSSNCGEVRILEDPRRAMLHQQSAADLSEEDEFAELESMGPSNDALIASARKHRPPQEWYDESIEGL